jgi:hypothetical protein
MRRSRRQRQSTGREAAGPLSRLVQKEKNALSTKTFPARIRSLVWKREKSAVKKTMLRPDPILLMMSLNTINRHSRLKFVADRQIVLIPVKVHGINLQLQRRLLMKIESFKFGSITIEGKTYTNDVIVYPDRVDESWSREEEHRPQIREFADIVNAEPDILIIGTGYAGVLSIPDQIRNYLTSKGIEVRVDKTKQAIALFNALQSTEKVIAALHITC